MKIAALFLLFALGGCQYGRHGESPTSPSQPTPTPKPTPEGAAGTT